MRVSFEQLQSEIKRVFVKYGLSEEKAETCARIHAESTYDGIYSHGVNRVSRFADYLQKGWVDANADPVIEKDCGAIRVVNGNLGPGVLNALFGADQAMALADRYGIGLVWGAYGVWTAMVVDWICRIICFSVRYRRGKWVKLAHLTAA